MKLSILIPALISRPYKDLINSLEKQKTDDVEILCEVDDGTLTSGIKRQKLLDSAQGDYICYLDDDDSVSENYIKLLLQGCNSGADIISFKVNFLREGFLREVWSLVCVPNKRVAGVMSLNHLCAWKKSIARRVSWCPFLGNSDDHLWFEPLLYSGLVNTNWFINESIYNYHFYSGTTINQTHHKRIEALQYFQKGVRCFLYGSEIVLEHDPRRYDREKILVRFGDSSLKLISKDDLVLFHTVTI